MTAPDIAETVRRIRERHDDLCLMYGDGAPWDESCVDDGEQAHTDRGLLLAELERVTGERDAALPDDMSRMVQINKLIADLQAISTRWGNTCVYIRRGGLSWGAVALHRRDDDKERGVFDLQAQHDRDMEERLGQVRRLIDDRNRERDERLAAEAKVTSLERELTEARADLSAACARERALISDRDEAHRARMDWFEKAKAAGRELAEARERIQQKWTEQHAYLNAELAQAKAQMRTPGTVEVCPLCGASTLLMQTGCRHSSAGGTPDNRHPIDGCPVKRAHSPAAKEAE